MPSSCKIKCLKKKKNQMSNLFNETKEKPTEGHWDIVCYFLFCRPVPKTTVFLK